MTLLKIISRQCSELINIIFPRRCLVCNRILSASEQHICTSCYMKLPFTRWHGRQGNGIERMFWARIPIHRANALLHYYGGDESRKVVLALKYNNRPQIGVEFGRIMAADLRDTDFFSDIDAIVPVPLARKRIKKRGYNQSECLAKGVSEITQIPVLKDVIKRKIDNPTQTRLTNDERKENVKGIFMINYADAIKDKHILLIDDVLTTGATIMSCAEEIAKVASGISIMTLFVAGRHSDGAKLS